jgi:hypothetical protein
VTPGAGFPGRAVQIVVIPPLLHPQHLDPASRGFAFFPNLGGHLVHVIPPGLLRQSPLPHDPVREQRQVILDAWI